jgi:hypothetical protein
MTAVKQGIKEIDVVSFVEAVGDWPAGTEGTVVSDYGSEKMVEIANGRGETLDLPVVPVENLRLVAKCGD